MFAARPHGPQKVLARAPVANLQWHVDETLPYLSHLSRNLVLFTHGIMSAKLTISAKTRVRG
jgi:hypothetical protein